MKATGGVTHAKQQHKLDGEQKEEDQKMYRINVYRKLMQQQVKYVKITTTVWKRI